MLLTTVSRQLGRVLPSRRALKLALSQREVALCMHRVHHGKRRATESLPAMSIDAAALDLLISELLEATEPGALTVSFDDGYRDAYEYVKDRAGVFPQAKFVFFVCPQRTEQQRGHAWDVDELRRRGHVFDDAVSAECAAAAHPDFALAAVDECRSLAQLPNVRLGNHTNRHLRMTQLTMNEAHEELSHSLLDFARLFGATTDLAFPYGVPGEDFDSRHVALAKTLAPAARLWSTERAAFVGEETTVCPRFSVDGTWPVPEVLSWMAVQAGRSRLFNTRRVLAG